jgi:hypothetical protein
LAAWAARDSKNNKKGGERQEKKIFLNVKKC